MKRKTRNILLATLFIAVSPLAAPLAQAQGMPFVPYGHHADKLAAKLKLNPEQKTQWDALLASTKAQHAAMKQRHQDMHAAMKAELAKPEPDLAALAAKADAARDQGQAAHRELRDGWLKLYAGMSPEQKGVVKAELLRHMTTWGKMRDKMRERMEHMREHMSGGKAEHGEHGAPKAGDAPPPK